MGVSESGGLENPERGWLRREVSEPRARALAEARLGRLDGPVEVLSGGLANLSLRIEGDRVLRVYERDAATLAKEAACLERDWRALRVPAVLERGVDFLVLEYVPHGALRGDAACGAALGRALAEIHATRYEASGFLGPDLSLAEPFASLTDALLGFVQQQLAGAAGAVLGELGRAARAHLERSRSLLDAHDTHAALRHGDFKVSNLHWTPQGTPLVLDWEFASAGPIWCDLGQLLRWSPPPAFVDACVAAYRQAAQETGGRGAIAWPECWRELAELYDLVALVGLCSGAGDDARRAADLRERIARTLGRPLPGRPVPGPPPLRATGLVLGRDGHFKHEGQPIRHARLREVLERSVCPLESEDAFVVRLGHFRGRIEVEDTAFFVRAYDADSGEVWLSDRSRERLVPETLEADAEGVLRCRVKGRFPARFTRAAQAHLLDALDLDAEPLVLRLGRERVPVPQLLP